MRVGTAVVVYVLLSACGGGSGGGSGGGGNSSKAPPTVSLSANPGTVPLGGFTTLTWSSSPGTTVCTASGGWSGTRPISGSETSRQLLTATTFILDCVNTNGNTRKTTTVGVTPPSLTFSVTPPLVHRGEPVTLQWEAVGLEQCQAEWGGFPFERALAGSEQFFPSRIADHRLEWQLELRCDGFGVSLSRFVNFKVKAFTGQLLFPGRISFDDDVNDPDGTFFSNDTFDEAHHFPWLHVLAGYVNQPQSGPQGQSFAAGDISDFFYTDGFPSGELTIRMIMPAVDLDQPVGVRDDADLYVYRSNGELVDASVGTGREEVVVTPGGDSFRIQVRSVTGSVTYLLQMAFRETLSALHATRLSSPFVPGEAVVVLEQPGRTGSLSKDGMNRLLRQHGLQRKAGQSSRELRVTLPGDLPAALRGLNPRMTLQPAPGTRMTPDQSRRLAMLLYLKALQATPGIRGAAPNRIYETLLVPDDPLYARQRWHYEMISLPVAWDITTGASDITVAVVDTGIARNHPDLESRLQDGYDMVSDPLNHDQDGLDPDFNDPGLNVSGGWLFHGTHVAGTIGALSNNALGASGVAWNVGIMPVRALDNGTGTLYDILQAVRYAAGFPNDSGIVPSRRADVINLSLGSSGDCESVEVDLYSELRAAGIIVAAAAGNSISNGPHTPASCPGVLSVASVGAGSERAYYSNYGLPVDLAAPGGDMRFDTDLDGSLDGVLSTHAGGPTTARTFNYTWLQGTSMAAPHVAGVMALMKSVNPGLTADDVESLLAAGALTDDLGPVGRDDLGYGLINAYKAVRAAQGIFDSAPQLIVSPGTLAYITNENSMALRLRNGGGGVLTVNEIRPNVPWITVVPITADANGLGVYQIIVDRAQIPFGSQSGLLEIATSAGNRFVPVLITGDAGLGVTFVPLYVVVADAVTGERVRFQRVVRDGLSYSFRFDDLPPGRYVAFGGTDLNFDQNVCDPGEICGGFPAAAFPEVIDYIDVREAIDVPLVPTALQTPTQTAVSQSH